MKNFLRTLFVTCAVALAFTPVIMVLDAPATAHAQITPIDEEPDDAPGLGSIIGSPEAGPKPEDPGDRGGYAQLGLALVLVCGVGFIASRVVRDAKRAKRSQTSSNTSATPSDPWPL